MNLLPTPNSSRIFGLDFLRAIAILWVVYDHSTTYINHKYQFWFYLPVNFFDGVTLFFVLSGFLIGNIFITQFSAQNFSLQTLLKFWIRRLLRTLPTFYVVYFLLLFYVLMAEKDLHQFSFKTFFFVQNFFSTPPEYFKEGWSLSVEEWFYVLFPMLTFSFLFGFKNKKNALLVSIFTFILIPFLLRNYFFFFDETKKFRALDYRNIVLFRLDSIMIGVLASLLQKGFHDFCKKKKFFFLFIGCFVLLFNFSVSTFKVHLPYFFSVLLFSIEPFAIFLCLPFFSEWKISFQKNIFTKAITIVSIISYSVYLLNKTIVQDVVIIELLRKFHLENVSWVYLTIPVYFAYWLITIGLAILLYQCIERPVMQWRNKNFSS